VVGASKVTPGAESWRGLSEEGEPDAGCDFLPVNASQMPILVGGRDSDEVMPVSTRALEGWPRRRFVDDAAATTFARMP